MTLLESFGFVRFVLEIPIPEQLLSDFQLQGVRNGSWRRRRRTSQPGPKVCRGNCLGEADCISCQSHRCLDAGVSLFAVLSKSRGSDLKIIHQLLIEKVELSGELYGFVGARTMYH